VEAALSANIGAASNFVVTAQDASNNVVTSYAGTVHFTSSDGAAVLPKDSALKNGVGSFFVTFETSGNQTISATDSVMTTITGTATAVLVSGPATHLVIYSPVNATAGVSFRFSVAALDAWNNQANGYMGTVHITSTDSQAVVLPVDPMLSMGYLEFTATLNTAGNKIITATDTVTAAITGTSNPIGVAVSRFKSAGAMGTPRYLHTATLLSNGKVLIAGGASAIVSPLAPLDIAELFDPTSKSFAATGSMANARQGQTATLLNNGKILIAGGVSAAGVLATAELYDPSTGTFALTGSMTTARELHTATLLGSGKVLIAGGADNAGSLVTAELYDPSTGMFTLTDSMTTAREAHTATLLNNGTVLIAGGSDMTNALATTELYDPTAGTFTLTGSMTAARESHTATLLNTGKVLMAGGVGNAGDLETAELFDPSTGIFTLTGNMIAVQRFHTATLLNDGTVLLAGGEYFLHTFPCNLNLLAYSSASAELYEPASGTFVYTGIMTAERVLQAATMLADGEVLMTGGNQWTRVGGGLPPNNCPSNASLVIASAEVFQ
jgi:hypothetical protein